MMKKILPLTLTLLVVTALLTGCGGDRSMSSSDASSPSQVESSQESPSSAIEEDAPTNGGPLLVSEELGFQVELPILLTDHWDQSTFTSKVFGETRTTLVVAYQGDVTANLFSFEEMSSEVWQKIQAEDGPHGQLLGTSDTGRVVIFNGPQSNPFKEGTPEFDALQQLPEQLAIIQTSFTFL